MRKTLTRAMIYCVLSHFYRSVTSSHTKESNDYIGSLTYVIAHFLSVTELAESTNKLPEKPAL